MDGVKGVADVRVCVFVRNEPESIAWDRCVARLDAQAFSRIEDAFFRLRVPALQILEIIAPRRD